MKLASRASISSVLWIAFISFAALMIVLNAPQLEDIARTLSTAHPAYVGALLAVQAVFMLNLGLFYASTFRISGLQANLYRFTLLAAAAHFVNLVSKTSGLGGLALYLREGSRQGEAPMRTTAAYMAVYAMGYVAFLALLLLSLILLSTEGVLTPVELAGSVVLFSVILTVAVILIRALRDEASLQHLLALPLRPLNFASSKLIGRPLISTLQVEETALELHRSVSAMRTRPQSFVVPFGHALAVELLSAFALFLVALALGIPLTFNLAIAGYALSLVFTILSVTPAGLGFVEASLVVFLASTGMTGRQAVAVTVGFRLFDFWLPVAIGGLSLLVIRFTGSSEA